jgi:hypothetical protein
MGPKSPKRCLINSCSGNEGSSDSYRTPEPTILEGRQLTETGSSLSSLVSQPILFSEKGLAMHADGEAIRRRRPQQASAARKTS